MADQAHFTREIISVSYVILADVQGPINLRVETEPLARVFGQLIGRANVAAIPGGYIAQAGPANLFQVAGNRIEFKGATAQILYELYRNARNLVMVQPYNAKDAAAFGVNLEANYTFAGTTRDQLLARMRPDRFQATVSLEGMRFKQTFGLRTNVLNVAVEKSNTNPDALFFNFNNHLAHPGRPSYSLEELTTEINQLLTVADQFVEEVYQCGQNLV
jgi:hypothetical protein